VLEQTTGIDPLAVNAWVLLGRARLSRGVHDPARRALARALEISPRMDLARNYLCVDLIASARPAEALAEAERAGWSWARATGQALAHHDLGRPQESGAALRALVAEHAGSASYQIAQIHAWRGEADLAFERLARALEDRDPGIAWTKGDPLLGRLRADPRYAVLLGRLGLPGG
jgi:serine/threonine-protein kinase